MIGAARAVLEQGVGMLGTLNRESYSRGMQLANGASIGGHYRHVLEHFRQLLSGVSEGVVDYDARNRDPMLENDPDEALRATRELNVSLNELAARGSEEPLEVICGISYGEKDHGSASSTLGREIIFCISHAIHHYALIAMILRSQGQELPPDFGVAPSTVRHRNSCSPSR
jgi:uncharacterized damage-inducible protein DinB